MKLIRQYAGMRKEVYVLFIGRVVTSLGSMVWPVLTLILNQKLGMSATAVSLVTMVSGFLLLPAGMLGGRIADRYNKKNCIIVCDMISIVLYLIAAFIPLSFVTIVLITLASTSQRMERPVYNALIADLTHTADREKAYSLHYLGINLGQVAAPSLAGMLFQNYLWLTFLICAVAIGISTVLIFLKLEDIEPVAEENEGAGAYQTGIDGLSIVQVLKANAPILLYILSLGLYDVAYHQFSYLMPLDMGRYHGSSGALIYGSVTSLNCIIVVLATPLITQLCSKLAHTKKNVLAEMMLLAGYLVFLALPGKIPFYYVGITLFTFGEILASITLGPYLTSRVPITHRGRINGVTTVVQSVFPAAMMPLVGVIYDSSGSASAWWFVILMILGSVIAGSILVVVDRKHYGKLYKT